MLFISWPEKNFEWLTGGNHLLGHLNTVLVNNIIDVLTGAHSSLAVIRLQVEPQQQYYV